MSRSAGILTGGEGTQVASAQDTDLIVMQRVSPNGGRVPVQIQKSNLVTGGGGGVTDNQIAFGSGGGTSLTSSTSFTATPDTPGAGFLQISGDANSYITFPDAAYFNMMTATEGGSIEIGHFEAGNYQLDSGLYFSGNLYFDDRSSGQITLIAGTATVTNTRVTSGYQFSVTAKALGTITTPVAYAISNIVNNTSFDIISADPTDTSTVSWFMFQ